MTPSCCDIAHDRRIFDVFAYESPGTRAFRLGHFAESATGYGRAEACEPDEPDHRPRRLVAELRRYTKDQ